VAPFFSRVWLRSLWCRRFPITFNQERRLGDRGTYKQ
jgi:hypothetical protein